jgi:large subunit ribosomal protein L25
MKKVSLTAKNKKRDTSAKEIRDQMMIPAILYGKKIKNQELTLDKKEFEKTIQQSGTSSIVELKIDSQKPIKTLIKDIQFGPVSDKVIHIDFYKIKKGEKIHTGIPIETTGKSPAVEEEGGNLIIDKDEIEVECLPDNLIEKILVDISVLKTFEDVIRVSDLNIPDSIEVMDEKDEVVATTTAPRTEEELEQLEETPTESDVDEVEVEAEKEEEEEGEKAEEEKSEESKKEDKIEKEEK